MKPKTRLEWFLAKIAGDSDATGSLTPRTRREYYLKEIADKPSGSGLPEVTSADNGKGLTVQDGEWAVTPSNIFWVQIEDSEDEETGDIVYTLATPLAELVQAADAGAKAFYAILCGILCPVYFDYHGATDWEIMVNCVEIAVKQVNGQSTYTSIYARSLYMRNGDTQFSSDENEVRLTGD